MPKNGNLTIVDTAAFLAGAGLGVAADKAVGDLLLMGNVSNPQYSGIQVHDVGLVVAELVAAYLARKTPLSPVFLGMAGSVIATDVFEILSGAGQWFVAQAQAPKPAVAGTMINSPEAGVNRNRQVLLV